MALSTPPIEITILKEREFATERSLLPTTTVQQESHEFASSQRLMPESYIDTGGKFFLGDHPFRWKEAQRIEPKEFLFDIPWLPPNVIKLLNKSKRGPITEKEMVTLMELVAERASEHFQLEKGKYVAMTFYGRIAEVSDTRVGLLKKLQSRKYPAQIFVWRIGYNAFSGRL
jgi:hypothetical protein